MRPRLDGIHHDRVIELISKHHPDKTPTRLIEQLIEEHYNLLQTTSLCPEEARIINNDNTEEATTKLYT